MLTGHVRKDDASWWIDSVMQTEGLWERTRGLLGREALGVNQALWITPCNSVHSIGMSYALDLIYLNKQRQVVKLVKGLRPLRVSVALRAYSVIELRAGEVARLNISEGDTLQWWSNE
jgi:hypothetical protein